MLCFDIDGTILDAQDQIHPRDLALLRQPPDDVLFVPTTGRSCGSLRGIFNQFSLFDQQKIPLPLILHNGAIVLAAGEQPLFQAVFPPEVQAPLLEQMHRFTNLSFFFNSLDQTRLLHTTPKGNEAMRRYDYKITAGDFPYPFGYFNKIMTVSDDLQLLAEFEASISSLPLSHAYSMPTIFEVIPFGISKATGIQKLKEALSMKNPFVIAAGDGGNDVAMLDCADLSAAPSNAPEEVRNLVDLVIDRQPDGLLAPLLAYARQTVTAD